MSRWVRARDAGLAIVAWFVVAAIAFWALGHVTQALLLLELGALLAYVLTPLVDRGARRLPRWLSIALVYLVVLAVLGSLGYLVVSAAVGQLSGLATGLPSLLQPPNAAHPSALVRALEHLGMTPAQIEAGRQQFLQYAQSAAGAIAAQAVPILTGVASGLLDVVLIVVISVYFVVDGRRVVGWLRHHTPLSHRPRFGFALDLLDHTVGGYVRGELLLASLIGTLVGVGMAIFRLPYALLLGVLAFVLEFIPILGVFISGAACVLVALTQGVVVALGVLAYFVGVHVVEGDVVGPRVIGRALGLHPVVAIVALVVGADLFGFWGALFAAPLAGVIQAVLVALWSEWRELHPEEFPGGTAPAAAPTPRRLLAPGRWHPPRATPPPGSPPAHEASPPDAPLPANQDAERDTPQPLRP